MLSFHALGDEIPSISTTSQDPAEVCSALDTKLPNRLADIRKLGKLKSEKVAPDTDYCGDKGKSCAIHRFEFPGLQLNLLELKATHDTSILTAQISSDKWHISGGVHVGQTLEEVEKKFGVDIPRNISPVVLIGDCTPLTLWHANGKVTQFLIDCQACI
jgi:hypothetical protein